MLLYAVLIPLLLLFVGVGLDMGWYYLTVSRMQNASDAAVMAGAWKFLEDEGVLSDYSDALLIDFVPNYILKDPDTDEPIISTRDKKPGDEVAKAYVQKNLAVAGATWINDTIADAYDEENNTLTFGSQLYGRAQDKDDYGYYTMWYRVELEEDVEHFFLPGWFPAMKATVQSVAKITHYIQGPNLFEQTKAIAEKQTYASWDHIKMAKSNAEADGRSVLSTGNKYRTGDKHRFELLRLNGKGGVNNNKYGNPYTTTGGKDQTDYDDLFIDWQADMAAMNTDTDIGINGAKSDAGKGWSHLFTEDGSKVTLTGNDNLQRRIHGTINFEPLSDGSFPYKVRDGKEPPDPLYARIESEPVHDGQGLKADGNGGYTRNSGPNGSSVRQIIINLNVPNMTVSGTDKLGYTEYSDRPVFFYYTGPEKNLSGSAEVVDYYDGYNEASHVRDSLPVIINFNADFRGIFFFPNSPVVVNGNENNFYGYIIAKEFVMLKTYDYKKYSDGKTRGGDFLRYVAPDTKDDVYYDRSLLVEGTIPVSSHDDFTSISINGQTKYVLKSDLITDASDLIAIGGTTYSKNEVGSAEAMAYASGNGKINYYYTLRKKKNEGWTLAGTGWLDRATAVAKNQLAYFQSSWSYNNSGNDDNNNGNPNGQGVWRVKELLADGSEGGWLDETDEYKNRFLLKVSGDIATHPPQYVYATAEELMSKIDGYSKIDGTAYWKKDDAREYNKVTSGGKTYYLPKNVVLFDSNMLVPEDMDGVIPVKYMDENNGEHSGCARISDDSKPYYLVYQDNYDGTPSNDNPMFVDELGNVQYRLQKNADGTDVEYDKEDDPVPYETIEPTVPPTSDDVLMNRAIETAVKEMIADLPEDETAALDTRAKQIAYLKEKYSDTYAAKVDKYFYEYFNYLEDDNVKFFAKDDFNLAKSVFDNFQLVKMTRYSYLNERETETADKRSINNFFTNSDAKRTD